MKYMCIFLLVFISPFSFSQTEGLDKEQLKAYLVKLKAENPEEFRNLMGEIRQSRREYLENLREEDPEKFKEIQQNRQEHMERLKEENPEKYERIQKKRMERRERMLNALKEKHEDAYHKLMAVQGEGIFEKLMQLKTTDPESYAMIRTFFKERKKNHRQMKREEFDKKRALYPDGQKETSFTPSPNFRDGE